MQTNLRSKLTRTQKQTEALKLIGSGARNICLFGGSRSGKTALIVYAIIIRALKVKSRHIILRLQFAHARGSVWNDTLPKILKLSFPELKVHWHRTEFYVEFPNGSEIWVGGLDDEKRIEKILGKEFSTMHFNEISQLSYKSVSLAASRLAEKNSLRKLLLYDMNPPSKKHWSYPVFIKKIDPITSEPLDQNKYASLLMNPRDNLVNIDEEYITQVLSQMPEKLRQRFELGVFTEDYDGLVYYSFDRDRNVADFSPQPGSRLIGMDFNVNPMTAVSAQIWNDTLYVHDEVFLENSDTFRMAHELNKMGLSGATIYPDSTGSNRKTSGKSDHAILRDSGFRIESTRNPLVFDRVNNVNALLKAGRIVIHPRCKKLINDLEKVSWKGQDLDQKSDPSLTHISDALGYLCWATLNVFKRQQEAITIS
jgi:PBSX family phage terminase large subunit